MSKKGNLSAALSQFDKRPTIVEDTPPQPVEKPISRPATEPLDEYRKAKHPPSRQGKKALTGYFDPEVLRQLKVMAAADDTTVQALMTEALNDLFKKHGKPHVA